MPLCSRCGNDILLFFLKYHSFKPNNIPFLSVIRVHQSNITSILKPFTIHNETR